MTLQEQVTAAIKNTPSLMGVFIDHEGMAKAAIDCIFENLLSDTAFEAAWNAVAKTEGFKDIGDQILFDKQQGEYSMDRAETALTAAIEAVKGVK